jgi:hypothetical protein
MLAVILHGKIMAPVFMRRCCTSRTAIYSGRL